MRRLRAYSLLLFVFPACAAPSQPEFPPLGPPSAATVKHIIDRNVTAAEFAEMQHEYQGASELINAFDSMDNDVPWQEPPTYDLSARVYVKGPIELHAQDVPVLVEASERASKKLDVKLDLLAIPNGDFATVSIADFVVQVDADRYTKGVATLASSERGFHEHIMELKFVLPRAIRPEEQVKVSIDLDVKIPSDVRVEHFVFTDKPPSVPGFKWGEAKGRSVRFEIDESKIDKDNAPKLFGLAPNGRRMASSGGGSELVGGKEFMRQLLTTKFEALPEKVTKPKFARRRVTISWHSQPSQIEIVVPSAWVTQKLTVTGDSDRTPLFHDEEHVMWHACSDEELAHIVPFAHRSIAMMGQGQPHLSLLLPDCVEFSDDHMDNKYKLESLKRFDRAGKQLPDAGEKELGHSGYRSEASAYTFYFQGKQVDQLGVVSGEATIKIKRRDVKTIEHAALKLEKKLGRTVLRVPVSGSTDVHCLLLDRSGIPLKTGSSSSSGGSDELVLEFDGEPDNIDKVMVSVAKEPRTLTVPFNVDFAKIPMAVAKRGGGK